MRIAIIGPFDIENFGDHLFKQVLEYQISQAIPDTVFDTFAVTAGSQGFDPRSKVYAIDDFEKRHHTHMYDALILAGGSTVHFETLNQVVRGTKQAYPIWKLWSQASLLAARHDIKLLWNNPEAPLEFEGWEIPVVRALLTPVDFLSVRNTTSRNSLQKCSSQPIQVGPDAAWLLREVYTDALLSSDWPAEVPHHSTVIFHCNQNLPADSFEAVITMLSDLQSPNRSVILLPLAYTNTEQRVLQKLQEASKDQFIYIDRVLSLPETIALFSACKLYIGLSFHGALTAACFGSEVVAFDYEGRRKTKELYAAMDKSSNYTSTLAEVPAIVRRTQKTARNHSAERKAIHSLQTKARQHFTKLITALQAPGNKPVANLEEAYYVAETEITKRFNHTEQMQQLSEGYARCYQEYQALLKRQK